MMRRWAGLVPLTAAGREGSRLRSQRCPVKLVTFRFTDHHVAELAFATLVEALHLNVIGGFWLQVADGMPVPIS